MMVDGCLAGVVAKDLRIDTGAYRTVVRSDYVPEIAYTGNQTLGGGLNHLSTSWPVLTLKWGQWTHYVK